MDLIKHLPFDIIGVISKHLMFKDFRLIQDVCNIPDRYFQGHIKMKYNTDYELTIKRYVKLKTRYYLAKFHLDLRHTWVIDVGSLGNVHHLDLSNTPVKDVSALGNVHSLKLSWTPVTDVSSLGKVHNLDLSFTKITV